jgi:hypothetical protein
MTSYPQTLAVKGTHTKKMHLWLVALNRIDGLETH